MRRALALARSAAYNGRAPFGAVVFDAAGLWIAGASNGTQELDHAELLALAKALALRGDLDGATLYSTHEPCLMCAGAIVHAKIGRLVYGSARDDFPGLFRRKLLTADQVLKDTSSPIPSARALESECRALMDGRGLRGP
jgi:tRNA(Arg) A34 adenosine deaminase TadA